MANKASKTKYVSKNTGHKATSASTLNAIKASRPAWEKIFHIHNAWKKGSNPWITIANPNKNDPSKLFIKVRYAELKGGSYKDLVKKNFAA